MMRLYMHPASIASRPVRLFAADSGIELDERPIDLMSGEHMRAPFSDINPNRMVPVLEDGDFRLTESSAILKYLADKIGSPAYPQELKARARVNEMMDWLNVNFFRDWGYGFVYPQIFPHHRRESAASQAGTIEWGRKKSKLWLDLLDRCWLGPDKLYLCGQSMTIADYFGSSVVTLGELIGCDFAAYPNIRRWLATIKQAPAWAETNDAFYGLAGAMKGMQFERLEQPIDA
jgi:glutathione S-transferase